MKKFFAFTLVLFIFYTSSVIADGFRVLPTTIATPLRDTLGCTVTFTNPHTNVIETRYIGAIVGKVKSSLSGLETQELKLFMSIEIDGDINYGDSSYTALHPYNINFSSRIKDEIREGTFPYYDINRVAGLQLAIWHYTDNLNINTIISEKIQSWATYYCNDTSPFIPYETLIITFPPFLEQNQFLVEGRWWNSSNGGWCPVGPYYISSTEGILSRSVVDGWPDSDGRQNQTVTIKGASDRTIVSAKSKYLIPSGIVFDNHGYRKILYIGFLDSPAIGEIEYNIAVK